jgi:putative transposase
MARKPRIIEPNVVYHVYNRRTDCQLLFPNARAFDSFVALVEEARERSGLRVTGYCAMKTHWHLVVWPRERTEVANCLRWLSATHAIRHRLRDGSRGQGHIYQDRYKSVPVCTDDHYLAVMRYVEANPLAAGLVARAEHWPWSSLSERLSRLRRIVDAGPVSLPQNWLEFVNSVHSKSL